MVQPVCRACTGLLGRPGAAAAAAAAAAAVAAATATATTTAGATTTIQRRPVTGQTQHRLLHGAAWNAMADHAQQRPARPPRQSGAPARSYHGTARNRGIRERIGDIARQAVQRTIEPYGAFGMTRQMYAKCTRPAAYVIPEEARRTDTVPTTADGEEIGVGGGIWHDEFYLLPSFSTWAQVTMLHMYLVVTRLRCLDKETYQQWQSMLVDHYFQEAEDKMDRVHHISSRGLRQRHLQDLFLAWRGVIVAYDEGIVSGDAVLAAALWRNLFKARPDMDLRHLAAVVAWMRRSLARLDQMPDEAVVMHGASGIFSWPPATADLATVDVPASRELKLLLEQAQQKEEPAAEAKTEQQQPQAGQASGP